ncbi:MAG: dihydroorotate dehydrogenase electron transfer subunit [Acidobacteriota bacterium]
MKIRSEYVSENCNPGNFVMIAVSGENDPLLKRPFGIFRKEGNCFYIYYEVVGKGSRLLSDKREGDNIMVVGPLGNSFPDYNNGNILLVGGGRGIAPLYFAAEKFSSSNNISLIYGARSKSDLLFTDELGNFPLKELALYTDDGSAYKKGLVVSDIKNIIERNDIKITFSCGPDKMFESLHEEIGGLGIDNFVSLEAFMGCGFGICHSCVVKGSDGNYKKVCSDGPVFRMEEIEWQT